MRILIGCLALASLSGCASVGDTRGNPALLTLSTSKPAKDVAECIRDGWQGGAVLGAGYGAVLQSSGRKYTVFSPDSATPWHLADIVPSAEGTVVRYHFYRTWQSPPQQIPDVVKRCTT